MEDIKEVRSIDFARYITEKLLNNFQKKKNESINI